MNFSIWGELPATFLPSVGGDLCMESYLKGGLNNVPGSWSYSS